MFIGHFGVAMAAKRAAPNVSLGILILAAQMADLLWPIFLLMKIERVNIIPGLMLLSPLDFTFPYSHSLAGLAVWGVALAAIYFMLRRKRADAGRDAAVLLACVLSHWFLDVLMHRPDMPLLPSSTVKYGLSLWNSVAGTLVAEIAVFGIGLALYLRSTKAKDAVGRYAFWALMVFLFVGWLSATFGPPPPSADALAWFSLFAWLLVPWAWWADVHRTTGEVRG